jgi:hypothetical protein
LVELSALLVAWWATADEVAGAVVSAGIFLDEMICLEVLAPLFATPIARLFKFHECGSVAFVFSAV